MKNHLEKLKKEIKVLRGDFEVMDKIIYKQFHPEIIKLKNKLQEFFDNQKIENFQLIKQLAYSEKDKLKIQKELYGMLDRLKIIEKEIGVRPKALTYFFDQALIDNQIMDKIIIETEDI